jgi:KUP system potassium uptake protein
MVAKKLLTARRQKKNVQHAGLLGLSLGALGVVYGDIGTSPLYAINEIFFGHAHIEPTRDTVMRLISLVLWSLVLVVAFKYVIWVLNADNEGEGGVFALFALLKRYRTRIVGVMMVVLIFAAGLLFGDGIITPAISVLSAIEGLRVATPALDPYIIPITVVVLTGLFAIQSRGTHKIGRLFGPIILCWFVVIAVLGLRQIFDAPGIVAAFNPIYALQAFTTFPLHKLLLVLGSVMLVVTGGEALYADMGHFGKTPIRLSWFSVVMPCLMLNYLGQGAFLLGGHEIIGDNVFYSMVPSAMLIPMVVLACLATIIASQALISGAFSLTSQGIALGLLPRLKIKHTHEHHEGQIYIAFINWALYVGCVALVITFGSTPRLANAYGLAVSGVMVATTLSMLVVARKLWGWSLWTTLLLFIPLLFIDSLFLTANSLKFLHGGFVPIILGILLYIIMSTWRWGRHLWRDTLKQYSHLTMGDVLRQKHKQPVALDRSLLVLTHEYQPKTQKDAAPALLELFMKKYHLLPRHVITLNIEQKRKPYIDDSERYTIKEFENDPKKDSSLLSITARFGFMEEPDVEKVIKFIADNDDLTPDDDMEDWILYVGRERIEVHEDRRHPHRLKRLRALLYSLLVSNSTPTYEYYGMGEDSRLSAELVPVRLQ